MFGRKKADTVIVSKAAPKEPALEDQVAAYATFLADLAVVFPSIVIRPSDKASWSVYFYLHTSGLKRRYKVDEIKAAADLLRATADAEREAERKKVAAGYLEDLRK